MIVKKVWKYLPMKTLHFSLKVECSVSLYHNYLTSLCWQWSWQSHTELIIVFAMTWKLYEQTEIIWGPQILQGKIWNRLTQVFCLFLFSFFEWKYVWIDLSRVDVDMLIDICTRHELDQQHLNKNLISLSVNQVT